MRSAADTLKKVSLELGGKSPNIFFADADFESAVDGALFGVFVNQGEVCSAGSRVLIQRPIYKKMLDAMVEKAKRIKLGSGMDPATKMGPLVSKEQMERVMRYQEIGRKEAKVASGGGRPREAELQKGYFVEPTIFYDVDNSATIAREEIFGPVMTVIPFSSTEEVVELSNDNEYGLAAAVWSRDIKKALNTARALRAGIVWINDTQPAPTEAPWGGYKQSGIGRELGSQGIEDYLEAKHIYVNLAE
jgi:betaine-aldehyde dehydrogenase